MAPWWRERLAERLARHRVRRKREKLARILVPIGTRVYVGGRLGIEGELVELSEDRKLATVVDDDGQAHWADAGRLYRLP